MPRGPRPAATATATAPPVSRSGGPAATGRVLALSPTKRAAGDRPWWVGVVYVLALVPVLVAAAVVFTTQAVMRSMGRGRDGLIRSPFKLGTWVSTPEPKSQLSELLMDVLKTVLDIRIRRASDVTYSQIRLQGATRQIACRYLAAPESLPVVVGDELSLWGDFGRDGVLRSHRLENVSAGSSHEVKLVPPLVGVAAAGAVVFCLMVLASAI
jgi:hypothetical protein